MLLQGIELLGWQALLALDLIVPLVAARCHLLPQPYMPRVRIRARNLGCPSASLARALALSPVGCGSGCQIYYYFLRPGEVERTQCIDGLNARGGRRRGGVGSATAGLPNETADEQK